MKKRERTRFSDPKVLTGLSVLLMLIGGMAIDPLAGLVCFVSAGVPALVAFLCGVKRVRYFAASLLIIVIALTLSQFPEALRHFAAYHPK